MGMTNSSKKILLHQLVTFFFDNVIAACAEPGFSFGIKTDFPASRFIGTQFCFAHATVRDPSQQLECWMMKTVLVEVKSRILYNVGFDNFIR